MLKAVGGKYLLKRREEGSKEERGEGLRREGGGNV